jgi:hypothetical protein
LIYGLSVEFSLYSGGEKKIVNDNIMGKPIYELNRLSFGFYLGVAASTGTFGLGVQDVMQGKILTATFKAGLSAVIACFAWQTALRDFTRHNFDDVYNRPADGSQRRLPYDEATP